MAVDLIVDSGYFATTFKEVVEHTYKMVLSKDPRRSDAKAALEILLNLAKKVASPFVDAAWIDQLLMRAAWNKMGDETFIVLLRLSALRKTDEPATDPEKTVGHDYNHIEGDEADPEGIPTSENPIPEYALLDQILRNVDNCSAREDGWEDDAVYGGLIAIKALPGLRLCDPKAEFIRMLSRAMEKRETKGEKDKPFRIRKAAYDIVLTMRDKWLRSGGDLRQTLEDVDFPRKLHSVVMETLRSDHQRSFLDMIEILSEDRYWHSYLRKAMDIWLPLHHEGPYHALLTLCRAGELRRGRLDYNVDKPLEKVVEEEWEAVPGRSQMDLTADLLGPLAEVTEQFKRLSFFNEIDRKRVLAVVEQVVPSLEKRCDEGYGGPDGEVRRIIEDLLKVLREPVQASGRWSTFW